MEFFEYIDNLTQPYDIFYSHSTNSPMHWHYYSEILFMRRGSVTITCNDGQRILHEGDLCYIYPLQLHEITRAMHDNVTYAVIKFDISTLYLPHTHIEGMYDHFVRRTHDTDFCKIATNVRDDFDGIDRMMDELVTEQTVKENFYSMKIQADIFRLLVYMARRDEQNAPHSETSKSACRQNKYDAGKQPASKIYKNHISNSKKDFPANKAAYLSFDNILEYIDMHSGENLSISELAAMCSMSYSHFAKLFRENYGRSCKEYITYIRLNKAQDLLLNTNYDISYIASETGFSDCSHFIRTYGKWRGITPGQERISRRI